MEQQGFWVFVIVAEQKYFPGTDGKMISFRPNPSHYGQKGFGRKEIRYQDMTSSIAKLYIESQARRNLLL